MPGKKPHVVYHLRRVGEGQYEGLEGTTATVQISADGGDLRVTFTQLDHVPASATLRSFRFSRAAIAPTSDLVVYQEVVREELVVVSLFQDWMRVEANPPRDKAYRATNQCPTQAENALLAVLAEHGSADDARDSQPDTVAEGLRELVAQREALQQQLAELEAAIEAKQAELAEAQNGDGDDQVDVNALIFAALDAVS